MKRKIIHIDAGLCNGCGNCIPNCPEGALQMIDGKARLVSDLFCDGLGACIGECPVGAITIEEREAAPYNERQVMENIVKAGDNTIRAHLRHLVLPAVALGLGQAALIARMARSSLLEVLGQDYVRTADAKGLSRPVVVVKHALRNALIPVVTVVGLSFAVLLAGAIVIETVFNLPGVGRLVMQSILRRDYPVIQGVILFIATTYVVINLAVDLVYGLIDPRVGRR